MSLSVHSHIRLHLFTNLFHPFHRRMAAHLIKPFQFNAIYLIMFSNRSDRFTDFLSQTIIQ